ncbi:MAG TPA: lysozyme [Sphingomonas sp.]
MTDQKHLFDAVRAIKGSALTQADVDAINAALAGGSPSGAIDVADKLTRQFEGCVLKAYPDPGSGGDPWTIGFGATGEGICKGVTWTQAQADARHVADLAKFAAGVDKLIGTAPTTDNQRGAMISLAYNVGLGNLGTSTLLRKHKAGDYVGAAAEFAKWNKAAGRVMAGLTRRREAERAVYAS